MLKAYEKKELGILNTSPQGGQMISRIFTDQLGQVFRLTFFVVMVNGELKGRLVSAQPIKANSQEFLQQDSHSILLLPVSCPKNITVTPFISSYTPFVSPFNELFFFTSQPTRAPSSSDVG